MEESEVVRVMRTFKSQLLRMEMTQMREMARRWLVLEQALESEINLLATELAESQIKTEKLAQLGRYQRLMFQLQREIVQYADYAGDLITNRQREFAKLGLQHAVSLIESSIIGVGTFFDILPVEAVELMAGLAGDGSPLKKLLEKAYPASANAISQTLIRGTALGYNPRKTAKEALKAGAMGLNRMLTVARTEQLRVYREASRQQYQSSGVIEGYFRLSARDNRVCPACLMSDGQFYDVNQQFDEHPNGRCTNLPKAIGAPAPTWEKGRDWFIKQNVSSQEKMLGKKRFEAWRDGKFDLDQLVKRKKNSIWGDSITTTPLKDLL